VCALMATHMGRRVVVRLIFVVRLISRAIVQRWRTNACAWPGPFSERRGEARAQAAACFGAARGGWRRVHLRGAAPLIHAFLAVLLSVARDRARDRGRRFQLSLLADARSRLRV
jgi:hypothetical protein